jgi:hypothetical protein
LKRINSKCRSACNSGCKAGVGQAAVGHHNSKA